MARRRRTGEGKVGRVAEGELDTNWSRLEVEGMDSGLVLIGRRSPHHPWLINYLFPAWTPELSKNK